MALRRLLLKPSALRSLVAPTKAVPCKIIARHAASKDTPLLRTNIGIFGAMNAGKSTLMNALTQHNTSIVDDTPGTTADVKISLMELHDVGPTKLFDTPGINENGTLGDKKRERAFNVLRECDVALVVANPFNEDSLHAAKSVLDQSRNAKEDGHDRLSLVIFNIPSLEMQDGPTLNRVLEEAETLLDLGNSSIPCVAMNLTSEEASTRIIRFTSSGIAPRTANVPLLPPMPELNDPNSIVLLNIPMDKETPGGRLLRPQALLQEQLLRNFVSTLAFRMDLGKGRDADTSIQKEEEERFRNTVEILGDRLKLIVTDSQAMDLVAPWTLDSDNNETVPLTTFSIMMINYLTGGRLKTFVEGMQKYQNLEAGSKVLICEACNHDRIQDDIGTVQIPNLIQKQYGDKVDVDFAFGREYQTKELRDYDLVVHCGGCMLDQQKMSARLEDIEATDVAITNYGLLLSAAQSSFALDRVLKPWGDQ